MLCDVKTLQKVLTSGAKIDITDIDISDDRIVMEDLDHVKHHLTESAWTSLNQEGKVLQLHEARLLVHFSYSYLHETVMEVL